MDVGACETWMLGRVKRGGLGVWNVKACEMRKWRCVECGGGVV